MTPLRGLPLNEDRRFRITGPFGEAEIAEYNDELTGYTDNLREVLGEAVVHYGGNAYYILNEARRMGFSVEEVR